MDGPGRGRRPGAAARRGVLYILVGALAVLAVLSLQRQNVANVMLRGAVPVDSATNATLHLLQEQVEEVKRLVAEQRSEVQKEFQSLRGGLQQAQKGSSQDQLEEIKQLMTSQQQAAKQDAQGLHDRLAALQQAQKEGGLALAEQLAQVKAIKMQASSVHVPAKQDQAPLAAVVAAAQKAQHDFCVQWRAGVQRPAGLPPNETYTRVEGVPAGLGSAGFDMPYYVLSSADIVSGEIQSSKTWERSDTAAVLGKLQEWRGARGDDVVLFDVGANLGWFAINAAALGYTVFAFEPVDYNIGAIRRTLCEAPPQLQSRFTLVTQGLSNKVEDCKLIVGPGNAGDGTTVCGEVPPSMASYTVAGTFHLSTLDELFRDAMPALASRVGVMKIDVEGHEPLVFAGGQQFMQLVRPQYMLAEVLVNHLQTLHNVSALEMIQQYDSMGYDLHLNGFDTEVQLPSTFADLAASYFTLGSNNNIFLSRKP